MNPRNRLSLRSPSFFAILVASLYFAGAGNGLGQTTKPTKPAETSPEMKAEKATVSMPEVVTREEWGAQTAEIPEDRKHEPRYLTVHHAGVLWNEGGDPYQKIKGLESFGKNEKGWPDLPYHYLIAPDGRIFEGRPVAYEPETNTSYDVTGHLGIQVWGNFEEQRVSKPQLEALVHVLAWLAQEQKVDPETISGHKDVADGTVCPGKDLYRYLEQGLLKKWVKQKLSGESPEIELLPPLEGGPSQMIPGSEKAP